MSTEECISTAKCKCNFCEEVRLAERKACALIARNWFGPGEPEEDPEDTSWITSHHIAQAILDRDDSEELL